MNSESCPFCPPRSSRIVESTEVGWIVRDAYPVTPGHTLVIPKRHVGSFFDLTSDEQRALIELLARAKIQVDSEHRPSAYNVGINDGLAAGQTVPHAHIHLIPRYDGDSDDPRGGVRWVVPDKADYWSQE